MKVAIVDYGMGNLRSIVGALTALGITDVTTTSITSELVGSDKLILPGVGHFAAAMKNIREKNWTSCYRNWLKSRVNPF